MKKKVIIEKFDTKYECIVRNGPFPREIEVKVAEILYPNRKFFKGGIFNYETFVRDITKFKTVESAIESCVRSYKITETRFETTQKKLNDFFETP
jgi:hypothetical protein